jgi:hypothetical protein
VVSSTRAQSALAAHAGSVSDSRVGADAPADAGRARRPPLPRLSRSLPNAGRCCAIVAAPRTGGVARAGLLCARAQPASTCARCHGERARLARNAAPRPNRAARASGYWSLHGGRRGVVRVRASDAAGGHERRASVASRLRAGNGSKVECWPAHALGAGDRVAPAHRACGVDAQSGSDGTRRARLHGATTCMHQVPSASDVPERWLRCRSVSCSPYRRGIRGTRGDFSVSLL